MWDSWNFQFLWRALIAGALLSVTAGLLSPMIVLRRMAFSSDGLAHASLGGLAAGMWLSGAGAVPTAASYGISFAFTACVAVVMAYFSGSRRIQSDTAIGACYVTAFSIGVILLSARKRHASHLEHFFFGSVLAASPLECTLLAALSLLSAAFCLTHWHWIAQWIFDEELARATGVHTRALRYASTLIIAAAVILATRVVGVLLITALLILPGATAILLAARPALLVAFSLASAMSAVLAGLVTSNHADCPPGPAIVLFLFAFFTTAWFWRIARDRRTAPNPHPSPSQPLYK